MSDHVPAEMPVGLVVRNAVHSDGMTCSTKLAASSDPSTTRPPIVKPAASSTTHATIARAGPVRARPWRPSITANAPARSTAEDDGASAVQKPESQKYANHAALLTLVSAAHAQEMPAGSPLRHTLTTCGKNCGMPNTVAAIGA